jgi:hypothetical protein
MTASRRSISGRAITLAWRNGYRTFPVAPGPEGLRSYRPSAGCGGELDRTARCRGRPRRAARRALSRIRGDLGQACSSHQQALGLARLLGIALEEAHALAGLGRCARAAGRTVEAEDGLRQALAILQRIGAAEAADVSAELDALPGTLDPASASL